MRKYLITLAFSVSLLSTPSFAQDWSGFYVGAHVGHAWADWDGNLLYEPGGHGTGAFSGHALWGPTTSRTIDGDGWLGGVQLGFNNQVGTFVWGLEGDISWTGIDGSDTFRTLTPAGAPANVTWDPSLDLEVFGTIRGRVGVLASPDLLLYGTGGLAIGRTDAKHVATHLTLGVTGLGSTSETHVGWTLGGGLEWLLAPNWSLKGEYLYVDLGREDYRFTGDNLIGGGVFDTDSFPADLQFHTLRVGLNYKFGARESVVPLK